MRQLLTVIFLSISGILHSQVIVNDINLNERKDIEFIQIVGIEKGFFSNKLVVAVDFGEEVKWKKGKGSAVLKDGKQMEFHSMVSALNFFYNNGWDFVDTYSLTVDKSSKVYHFLLRRKH
jgi:hypothetical protein